MSAKINWKKLAIAHRFLSDYDMLIHFRRKKMSSGEVSKILGVSDRAIRERMKELSIQRLPARAPKGLVRSRKVRDFSKYVVKYGCKNERELLYHFYWKKRMLPKAIGLLLGGCPGPTIITKLKALGIRRRARGPLVNANKRG